jgi:hypothetical protein
LFRAVYCGPGQHEVRFYYRQHGLKPGLAISLVTLALFGVLWKRSPGGARAGANLFEVDGGST